MIIFVGRHALKFMLWQISTEPTFSAIGQIAGSFSVRINSGLLFFVIKYFFCLSLQVINPRPLLRFLIFLDVDGTQIPASSMKQCCNFHYLLICFRQSNKARCLIYGLRPSRGWFCHTRTLQEVPFYVGAFQP
jgi:hypothetical protein